MRRAVVVPISLLVAGCCACVVLVLAILLDGPLRHSATVLAVAETLALVQAMLHADGAGPVIGLDVLRRAVTILCFAPVVLAALLGEVVQTASLVWYAGLSGAISAAIPVLLGSVDDGGPLGEAGHAASPLLPALVSAGVVAGAVYWALSGRHVGSGRAGPP